MPLTPEEQARLAELSGEFEQPVEATAPASSVPSLESVLLGKAKLPKLGSPEQEAFGKNLAEGSVNAIAGSFSPPGTANPLSYIARKTGISSIPDRLMQKAVGMKKYIPGVGESLVDQGVIGTKGMMQKQVAGKLAKEGANLDTAISAIKSPIESAPVAETVANMTSKYSTPGGIIPEAVKREYELLAGTAKDIAGRGAVSPQEALKLKRIAQQVGYKQGEPLSKLASQAAQQEAAGYGKALEKAYSASVPEGSPNAVAEANAKLAALLKGSKGLNRPETMSSSVMGDLMAGGAGSLLVGNPAGGLGAIAARRAIRSPLGASTAAHVGQKVIAPSVIKGSEFGAARAAMPESTLSQEEQQRLLELEKEFGNQQ